MRLYDWLLKFLVFDKFGEERTEVSLAVDVRQGDVGLRARGQRHMAQNSAHAFLRLKLTFLSQV